MSATEFETLSPAAKRQSLIDVVIEQMKQDIEMRDWTAIEELLNHVPLPYLQGYLGEDQQIDF